MEASMKKTWKPTTAGILNITSGALNALGVIAFIIAITAVNAWQYLLDAVLTEELHFVAPLVSTMLIILLVLSIIEAVFPIVGGVFALQRRKWGWALAGSVISILRVLPLGIVSTIFVKLQRMSLNRARIQVYAAW